MSALWDEYLEEKYQVIKLSHHGTAYPNRALRNHSFSGTLYRRSGGRRVLYGQLFIDDVRYEFLRDGPSKYWTDNLGKHLTDFHKYEDPTFSAHVSLYEAGEGIYSLEIRNGRNEKKMDKAALAASRQFMAAAYAELILCMEIRFIVYIEKTSGFFRRNVL